MNTNLSFSSSEILLSVLALFVIVVLMIVVGRIFIAGLRRKRLAEKYKTTETENSWKTFNKYPDVDVLRNSEVFRYLGLALTLGIMVVLFNWTTYEENIESAFLYEIVEDEITVEPPRTKEQPPPPPPPPPPVIQEVPEEFITEEDETDFLDQSIDMETDVNVAPAPKPKKKAVVTPPPPPPAEPEIEEIFKVVEDMPRFPGCESTTAGKDDLIACASKKLYEFIYKHIKYPRIANENGIDGMVVIQFVVEKDGSIAGARIVRDIGGGCGNEALRVVNLMNEMPEKWVPGKQRGRPVRVMFNLPVRFKLVVS